MNGTGSRGHRFDSDVVLVYDIASEVAGCAAVPCRQ